MQHIPYTSLDDIKHGEREMSQFNEDFKKMYGHYPGQSGQAIRLMRDEEIDLGICPDCNDPAHIGACLIAPDSR